MENNKIKMVIETLISVIIVTFLITLMVRSYILHEWIFGGAYLFVLVSLAKFRDVKDNFKKIDKLSHLKDNLSKLEKITKDLKPKDGKEENDE